MESINMFCALQRVLLPTILGVCTLYRPVGISLIYLIMFLILPFVPLASGPRLRAPVMAYFIIFIILSSLILLCHFGLGIWGYVTQDKSLLGGCSYQEVLFRHIGFNHLDDLSALDTVECIWPDVLVFLSVVIIFAVLKKFAGRVSLERVESRIDDQERLEGNGDSDLIEYKILKKTGPTVCLVSLFLAAILRPSVPGGFYFLVVLLSATHWACYKRFASGFGIILRCVMTVLVFHIVAVMTYQTPWAQEKLHNSTLPARLLALESIVISVCFAENEATESLFTFNAHLHSDSYLSPIIILASYYILALTSSYLINKKATPRHERRPEPNEKTPLTMGRKSALNFDENPETETDSIELRHFGVTEEGTSATLLDHIWYGVQSTSKFVYRNSYIFTNILMMVWSIVYHSWLTFFLLIWAYILWMIPNQRKAMLRSSPFVVFYAQLLLIAQYIYGMRLNDDELPTRVEIKGINLKQIGFGREEELPCVPLIIKTLFTLMFWFTLRQRCKEAEEKKKKSTLADMVAPLQLTMGAAASDLAPKQEDKKTSKFFEQFGTFIRILLIKSWMWLLLVIVFLSGITGTKMTGFRICYMALFLFFILAFQCSWRVWLKVMYGFWVFLIIYVMSILIMIYTYQFDRFDEYWYNYLNISMELQKDIGLQQYETKDLFLHLVTPTLLVIMTIIQIHYFHKRFVEHLKIDIPVTDSSVFNEQRHSEEMHHPNEQEQGPTTADLHEKGNLKQFKKLLINLLKRFYHIFRDFAKNSLEFFWMLLELHMIKVIFLTAFINCVVKVSVLHIAFVFLCVIAIITKTSAQIYISRLISILVSILILANMIYQVDYIDHTQHNVKCNNGTSPTLNNAEWFGLQKISVSETLLYVLRGYIVYIVVTTLHAVAIFRQEQRRAKRGLPLTRPHLMFKNTTVEDAYKNVVGLIKYLFNYGFYRLGFEVSLITLVATISYRQDLLAIVYALWLCIFFCLERERSERIWIVFQWFVAIVIPVQYILFVGLPPSFCIAYPWETHFPEGFYPWAILPGPKLLHESRKVIFDFVLLLFITRQRRAYSIEKKYEKRNAAYPGGKNKPESIDTEKLGMESFQNPVHDFRTTVRNWLDVLFTIVFVGFFWTTLAVVFLAGTSVVSAFSLGYLVGAFIFLWQGTDFYLHPLRKILLYWRIFLGYNVIIITLKTIFQIGVCFFFVDLIRHTCWLVHILGVSCIGNVVSVDDPDHCPPLSTNSGISWDATCFAFLIFQLRIFGSQYFQHVINDAKATGILASRGAMLIEDFRQKQIQHRTNHERDVLRKIKAKMERIRATQKGISRPIKKPTHYDEITSPLEEQLRTETHSQAIRVGDYFMFTDPEEKIELSLMDEGGDFLEDEGKISASEKKISKRKGLFEEKEKTPKSPDSRDKPSSSSSPPKEADEEKEIGLLPRIFEGLMVSFAIRLNRLSRNYRYVMTILSDEKKILKEALTFGHGGRPELVSTWKNFKEKSEEAQHTNSDTKLNKDNLENQSLSSSDDIDTDTKSITLEIDVDTKDNTNRIQPDASMALVKSTEEFDEVEFTTREHNIIVEVLISMWYVILSNTAILCYLCVFINQINSASILSLPLPIMVFIWGTLAIPRPSKFFWITLIAYTQCIVIVKCIFQFKTFMFKDINLPNQPLAADKIIGIQPEENYAIVDLLLLLVVFFHRFILKSQGLWDAYDVEPNVQSGTYILKDELPEDDDTGTLHEARQTAIVTSGNDTLVITKKKLGDDEEVDELNLQVSNNLEEPGNYVPEVVKISSKKYFSPAVDFFKSLLYKTRLPTDVYALMFLCDFINFLVLLFGFTAFGTQSGDEGGVQDIFTENKVPIPFLIMLLVQFLLIIIDRALYLRKALIMKIVFHFISVIGIHIWMFFILPAITERNFNSLLSPVIFYMIKCFYFLLSSYQITCGYPKRILGNFLTRGYTIFNMHAFRVYKMVPFLFELRTFLDWVCTDTTMTMWEWLKMEDIFSEIFFLKCNRDYEKAFPVPRAHKKDMISKILLGGTFILLSVVFIWAPLTLFAVFTAVGQSNVPTRVVTTIKIGSYHPIYEMSTEDEIYAFEDKEMLHLQAVYLKNKTAMTFITAYYPSDIAAIVLPSHSATVWGISPPDLEELIEDLNQNRTIPIRLTYSISRRSPKDEGEEVINLVTTYELGQNFEGRQKLIGILEGKSSTQDFIAVPDILPKFIEVKNTGKIIPIKNMLPKNKDHTTLLLKLSRKGDEGNNVLWWEIKENCNDSLTKRIVTELPHTECGIQIAVYTFNDKKFPPTFTWVSASGIIGMYTGFVLVASRLLRGILFDSTNRIMFSELPYVDRILQLCLDVYLVREAKEFELEEDLFGKLLFLYRSPETMIKWTRPKKSIEEDGQDTESRSTTRRMPE